MLDPDSRLQIHLGVALKKSEEADLQIWDRRCIFLSLYDKMLCPCGLTKEEVRELNSLGSVPLLSGRCQNPRADDSPGVCGKALGAHSTHATALPQQGRYFPVIFVLTMFPRCFLCSYGFQTFSPLYIIFLFVANQEFYSLYKTPSPPKQGSAKRNSAKQDSFRKKLIRRNKFRTTCDICGEVCLKLEAAHVLDLAKRSHLEEAYLNDKDEVLPASVNDACNGLLLCPTCHAYFDSKDSLIQISGKGKIILKGELKKVNYRSLHNADVPWASCIGVHKDFPTKELLELAQRLKPEAGKRLRELILESEEDEEVVRPSRKKTVKKK